LYWCEAFAIPAAVPGFEYDMAYAPAELAAGVCKLFDTLGYRWRRDERGDTAHCDIVLPSGHAAHITIGPLPPERASHTLFFPRALLTAHSDDAEDAEIAALRHTLLTAFLRVTG
jgi:hypothetical protein